MKSPSLHTWLMGAICVSGVLVAGAGVASSLADPVPADLGSSFTHTVTPGQPTEPSSTPSPPPMAPSSTPSSSDPVPDPVAPEDNTPRPATVVPPPLPLQNDDSGQGDDNDWETDDGDDGDDRDDGDDGDDGDD